MDDLPIVDAHHHFWDPRRNYHPWLRDEPMIPFRYGSYAAIRRPYLPEHYFADAAGHRVVKTVLMEGEWDPTDPVGETSWVAEIAAESGFPTAMVAQAWLDREDVEEVLAAQAAFPIVRSVRHKPRAAPAPDRVDPEAPGSMGDPKWRRGFALLERFGLMFDLQSPWWHLGEAARLARAFPTTTIVLNHTGLPADRSPEGLAGWRAAMRTLAGEPNVVVKISGIGVAGQPWTVETNRCVVLDTIEAFGVARCMFASNFPVDGLVGSYDAIMGGFKEIVADFPLADRRALCHDNAVRVYRLE
jgi:predicted TIM-barrel fold metal-dependent hydrolase